MTDKKKMRLMFEVPQKDSDQPLRSGIAHEWTPDMTGEEKLQAYLSLIAALTKHEVAKFVRDLEFMNEGELTDEQRAMLKSMTSSYLFSQILGNGNLFESNTPEKAAEEFVSLTKFFGELVKK